MSTTRLTRFQRIRLLRLLDKIRQSNDRSHRNHMAMLSDAEHSIRNADYWRVRLVCEHCATSNCRWVRRIVRRAMKILDPLQVLQRRD